VVIGNNNPNFIRTHKINYTPYAIEVQITTL